MCRCWLRYAQKRRCTEREAQVSDDVTEVLTDDGRHVLYSTDEDADEPADTREWVASDATVSGSDQE